MPRRSIRHSNVANTEPTPNKDEKAQGGDDVQGVSEEDITKAVMEDCNPVDDTNGDIAIVASNDKRGDANVVKGDVASSFTSKESAGKGGPEKDQVMEDGEGEGHGHSVNAPISDGDAKISRGDISLNGDAGLTSKESAGKGGPAKDQVMEDGDTNGNGQGAKIPRRKSPRMKSEGADMITSANKSPAAILRNNTPRRKSPRIKEVEAYSKGTANTASAAKKTSAAKRPKRKAAEINQDTVSKGGGAKNPPKRQKAERTPHVDESYMPGEGWTRGSYIYNSNVNHPQHRRYSWVSPTEKIEFKYRVDAFTFESLRQNCGNDEVQAWIEVCVFVLTLENIGSVLFITFCVHSLNCQYTKLKSSERKNRDVIDPKAVDEQLNLDINVIRQELNAMDQIGPGWGLEKRENKSKRWRWISPTRGMKFRLVAILLLLVADSNIVCLLISFHFAPYRRYRMDAQLFESLRKKYGEDEIQAWLEVCDRFIQFLRRIAALTFT